jgi:hypothetical protein
MSNPRIEPFKISFPEKDVTYLLDSLKNFDPSRLVNNLLPGSQSLSRDSYKYGIPTEVYLELLSKSKEYNWREWETKLNEMGDHGIMHTDDGTKIHFVHKRCTEKKEAKALLLVHGWP